MEDMPSPAGSYALIDLEHMGRRQSVGACLLETDEGPLLVDPGPSSTLARLGAGLAERGHALGEVAGLLLTHIHLDHAGASGTLAREIPGLRVYVHQAGATHLIDPSKLLASATRLYGDRMEALWGEVAPVPADRVTALAGGERLAIGGRSFEVAYTPGHAWHHLSYFEPATGVAFVGDTAGIYGPRLPVVLPVTPPPDFDLEAWQASIRRILAWAPAELVLTHYGPATDPARHLEQLAAGLVAWTGFAEQSLTRDGTEPERIGWFVQALERWIEGKIAAGDAAKFLAGAGPEACWHGLARYLRKRADAAAPAADAAGQPSPG